MLRIILSVTVLLGLALSSTSQAALFVITNTNSGNIPDAQELGPATYGQPFDMVFDVSGTSGTVQDVVVSFTATHTWLGDLRVSLIAPNGKTHLLFARTGASTQLAFGWDNILDGTYTFSDSASDNWWTIAESDPVPSGTSRTVVAGGKGVANPPPVTSLNTSFAATAANGQWVLRFEDGARDGTGTVAAASLQLTVEGSTHIVTHADDSGAGSLRGAITDASPGDQITFDSGFFSTPQTINLSSNLPNINKALAIVGPGADLLTLRRDDNTPDFPVINISPGLPGVSLSGMTISNGRSYGGISSSSSLTLSAMNLTGNFGGYGGGLNLNGGEGYINNTTISGNSSFYGGGIFLSNLTESVTLVNCTVSGNHASSSFGGIMAASSNGASFTLEILSSTVTGNFGAGIGVEVQRDEFHQVIGSINVNIGNSIVANNLVGNFLLRSEEGNSTIASHGFNLSNNYDGVVTLLNSDLTGDAKLGPLALQGGATPTHLLLAGSAALDAGNSSGAAIDQRGMPRPFDIATIDNNSNRGNGADIGAVEMQAIFVTNPDNDGVGSLRAAIGIANAGPEFDDILFDQSVFATEQAINLTQVLPGLTSMSITAPGADFVTVSRSSGDLFRIFAVPVFAQVSLTGLAIADGDLGSEGAGGGIMNEGTLALTEVVLRNNHANGAGGVVNHGNLVVTGSTFSGNSANFDGGAIYNIDGFMRLVNSTISGNDAGLRGAGIMNASFADSKTARLEVISSTFANNSATSDDGAISTSTVGPNTTTTTYLRNSLFANNSPQSLGTHVFSGGGPANIFSRGFNLASDDSSTLLDQASDKNSANANLGPLTDNLGPTQTHALRAGSAALDAGNTLGSGVSFDQRGTEFKRLVDLPLVDAADGDGSDIGAFEAQIEPEQVIFVSGFE